MKNMVNRVAKAYEMGYSAGYPAGYAAAQAEIIEAAQQIIDKKLSAILQYSRSIAR